MTPLYLETQGAPPHGRRRRIDFSRVSPGDIIAIVGKNGQGKSQLGFAIGGALYGKIEGYPGGSHVKDCLAEEADTLLFQLWFRAGDGHIYRIRRQVDARNHVVYLDRLVSPERPRFVTSGAVVEVEGAVYQSLPENASGLVGEVPDELRRIGVLPYDLWMAAGHAHQTGLGDFFSIEGADAVGRRRQILAEMLGARETQRISDAAQVQRKAAQKILDHTLREIERVERDASEAARLREERARAEVILDQVQSHMEGAQARAAAAEKVVADLQEERRAVGGEVEKVAARVKGLRLDVERGRRRLSEIDPELARLSHLKDRAGDLAAVHQEAAALSARCAALVESYRGARERQGAATGRVAELTARLSAIKRPPADLILRRGALEAEAASMGDLAGDRVRLTEERAEGLRCRLHVQDAPAGLARLDGEISDIERQLARHERAAALSGEVPCGGAVLDGKDCGACQFLADAAAARAALPDLFQRLEETIARRADTAGDVERMRGLNERIAAIDEAIAATDRDLAHLSVIQRQLADIAAAEANAGTLADLEGDLAEARAAVQLADEEIERIRAEGGAKKARLQDLGAGRAPEAVVAWLRSEMDAALGADAALAALGQERQHIEETQAEHAAELATLDVARAALDRRWEDSLSELAQARIAHDGAAAELAAIIRQRDEAQAARDRVDGRIEAHEAAAAELPRLVALRADALRERDDWRLIEDGMGIKGVQGLMIDLAGPAFSRKMNDLLGVIYDPHEVWDVVFRTYDPTAKGAKREVADLLIKAPGDLRHRAPRVSPGQQQPLKIAMRGGAIDAIEREHGARVPFAIADELENHLDPDRRRRYLETLKAMGLRTWMVVTHHEEIIAQADHVLRVDDSMPEGCTWER